MDAGLVEQNVQNRQLPERVSAILGNRNALVHLFLSKLCLLTTVRSFIRSQGCQKRRFHVCQWHDATIWNISSLTDVVCTP
jgi:hypothetical protein